MTDAPLRTPRGDDCNPPVPRTGIDELLPLLAAREDQADAARGSARGQTVSDPEGGNNNCRAAPPGPRPAPPAGSGRPRGRDGRRLEGIDVHEITGFVDRVDQRHQAPA